MSSSPASNVVDLVRLRRSCAQCSLHQLCLPAALDQTDLDTLDRIVRSRRPIRRGERLFEVGSPLQSLYVARDGAFKTSTLGEDGGAQVIAFHLPGELIGLDALGSDRHRCEAEALEPSTVCEVPFDQLQTIASGMPGLQQQLLRVIGRGMQNDHGHVGMMGRRQAIERIALFLMALSERYRNLGRPGDTFALPMTREDIGNYLGLVIETVSRGFSKLSEDGVIAVRGRQVRILQAGRLEEIAQPHDHG